MSRIAYDPIKNRFARVVRGSSILRRAFYFLLDLFFLRSWYIRRELLDVGRKLERKGDWTLLDAGSGFGQYDRFILSRFSQVRVDSVDLKEEYLEDCRTYFQKEIDDGRISFARKDLLEPIGDLSYDVVLCVDVLEHIEEDSRVFQNLSNALKPGGILIMHSPSHYSEEDALDTDSFVEEHARPGYSPKDLSHKLSEAGLRPVKVYFTYGKYGHLAWIWSVKRPMMWMTKFGFGSLLFLLVYYPIVIPVCLVLNLADLYSSKQKGYGICGVGVKRPG